MLFCGRYKLMSSLPIMRLAVCLQCQGMCRHHWTCMAAMCGSWQPLSHWTCDLHCRPRITVIYTTVLYTTPCLACRNSWNSTTTCFVRTRSQPPFEDSPRFTVKLEKSEQLSIVFRHHTSDQVDFPSLASQCVPSGSPHPEVMMKISSL